jgi:hypothetical protein
MRLDEALVDILASHLLIDRYEIRSTLICTFELNRGGAFVVTPTSWFAGPIERQAETI